MAARTAAQPPAKDSRVINIARLSVNYRRFALLGTSPLVFHKMSQKSKDELLLPRGPMTAAAKKANLKHDPIEEFRSSVYRRADHEQGPTRLQFPAGAIKQAMAQTALDLPDVAKTQIQRLTWVEGDRLDIFGTPELMIGGVRLRDQHRTPDIHTWAVCRRWATFVEVRYIEPHLSEQIVANLLWNAGLITGIGDGRQEKGHFSYGQWIVTGSDDPALLAILEEGMAIQDEALAHPTCYDAESEEMLTRFTEEYARRGRRLRGEIDGEEPPEPPPPARRRRRGNGDAEQAAL